MTKMKMVDVGDLKIEKEKATSPIAVSINILATVV